MSRATWRKVTLRGLAPGSPVSADAVTEPVASAETVTELVASAAAPAERAVPPLDRDQPRAVRGHLVYRDRDGALHLDWPLERVGEAIQDSKGVLWADFETEDEAGFEAVKRWLEDHFGFHQLAIKEALQDTRVSKVDDWGPYLYIVFGVPRLDRASDFLEHHELDMFLGANYLVTYHTAPLPLLEHERAEIQRDPRDRLRRGPDHLLVRLLDLVIEESLKIIEQLDDRVDELQNEVIEHPTSDMIRTIFRIKLAAIRLHKALVPQREVLNHLARDPFDVVQAEHRVYFRDLHDHLVRIHEISEGLRDLITGTLETYLSVVSNRTNEIMKILTMVTVMFMPMSFLTGFFGMNFFGESIALHGSSWHSTLFLATCVIMAFSPCAMWIYARRKKWF